MLFPKREKSKNKIMKVSKYFLGILLITTQLIFSCCSCSKDSDSIEEENEEPVEEIVDEEKKLEDELTISVSVGGNSWVINDASLNRNMISDEGLKSWKNKTSVIRTFVRVNKAGSISVGIKAKQTKGSSKVKITIGEESKEITINNQEMGIIPVGRFNVSQEGYVQIDMQGVSKSDYYYGEVSHIIVGGDATSEGTDFVKEEFYWGRRGPSVHMAYNVPSSVGDVKWFYNEVTVNEGDDVLGSYFMANGFGEGYFGIQVNSETERRILFSVWSSYVTDDPNNIPEDEKIKLLKKGDEVKTGEFGNEGSGGQSYRVYNWKAGNTYKFLLKGEPSENNSTDYTAYFFAPEIGTWELIASFRRPKTSTYLTHPHSFLENFNPDMGFLFRKASYANQWVQNTHGNWTELNSARFTADATAHKGSRLDYAGGVEDGTFFLKNCGFFSDRVPYDTSFTRAKTGVVPSVNLNEYPFNDAAVEPGEPDNLDRSQWKIIDFSSEQDGEIANYVLDGDGETFWHSRWSQDATAYPHHLTIDMSEILEVTGFSFLQRDGMRKVKDIEIFVSTDNTQWESIGNYQLKDINTLHHIYIPNKTNFRYFKVVAKSAFDGDQYAAMAEIMCF